ncbi:MAG: Prephenate dehydrogenase [Chthoniobacteraceae bacterium]|nr:Prephenate dehydrogenase [Chthoniobacteraceae bacterium]
MNKVAILGPGLLGGSIALALRARGIFVSVWARRQGSADEAMEGGFADEASTSLAQVVREAEIVVLCTPIEAMPALARELVALLPAGCVITDVGSVKATVVTALTAIFDRAHFVGSHPMAGSEQTGMKAARADLFSGTVCIVTPNADSNPAAVALVSSFWEMLGCDVRELTPEMHDAHVAMISHFPHLLAASLVDMISEQNPAALEFCGPGFRDTTRVASGSPALWTGILLSNRDALRKSTEAMIEKLREILTLLDSQYPDQVMHEFLTQSKALRDSLRLPR